MVDVNEEDALRYLEEQDRLHKVNNLTEPEEVIATPVKSLGQAQFYERPELSQLSESPWKMLNQTLLPSQGLFYPEKSEML